MGHDNRLEIRLLRIGFNKLHHCFFPRFKNISIFLPIINLFCQLLLANGSITSEKQENARNVGIHPGAQNNDIQTYGMIRNDANSRRSHLSVAPDTFPFCILFL